MRQLDLHLYDKLNSELSNQLSIKLSNQLYYKLHRQLCNQHYYLLHRQLSNNLGHQLYFFVEGDLRSGSIVTRKRKNLLLESAGTA